MERIARVQFQRCEEGLVGFFSEDMLSQLIGKEFIVCIGPNSLIIHTPHRWREILDRIDEFPMAGQRKLHPLLLYSARIQVRDDGSWTLPRSIAKAARIENEAFLCIPEPSDRSVLTQKSLILTAHY